MKKFFATLLTALLVINLFNYIPNTKVLADEVQPVTDDNLISQDQIDRIDPYVLMDSDLRQFYLASNAQANLSSDDLAIAQAYISDTNLKLIQALKCRGSATTSTVKTAIQDGQISSNEYVSGNSIVLTPPEVSSSESSGNVQIESGRTVIKSPYYYIRFYWYGVRWFISHDFIEDLRAYAGTFGYVDFGVSGSFIYWLMSLGMPGYIAALCATVWGGSAYYMYETMLRKEVPGHGEYLDFSYTQWTNVITGIPTIPRIYTA